MPYAARSARSIPPACSTLACSSMLIRVRHAASRGGGARIRRGPAGGHRGARGMVPAFRATGLARRVLPGALTFRNHGDAHRGAASRRPGRARAARDRRSQALAGARAPGGHAAAGVDQEPARLRRPALLAEAERGPAGSRRSDDLHCVLRDLERRVPRQRPARRAAGPAPSREAAPADRQRGAVGGRGRGRRRGAHRLRDWALVRRPSPRASPGSSPCTASRRSPTQ